MSETTTYQVAPGITVRQRISVKQTAKGEFQRDYTVEITGTVDQIYIWPDGEDVHGGAGDISLVTTRRPGALGHSEQHLEILNDIVLRRAEADYQAHIARIKAAEGGGS